jgi:hypothetical protein
MAQRGPIFVSLGNAEGRRRDARLPNRAAPFLARSAVTQDLVTRVRIGDVSDRLRDMASSPYLCVPSPFHPLVLLE